MHKDRYKNKKKTKLKKTSFKLNLPEAKGHGKILDVISCTVL